jgi:hypothetical protein
MERQPGESPMKQMLVVFAIASAALMQQPTGQPTPTPHPPRPGTVNYLEGEASIGAQALNANAVGTVDLDAQQTLTTGTGKVEVLLTPGIFLRLADQSAVTMIAPDLENTEVRVDRGRAMVEVTDIHKENHIQIDEGGARVVLDKTGLYDFDANTGAVRVFDGEAMVSTVGKPVKVKKEHAVTVSAGAALSASSFDTRQYEDDLFRWSALRSGYLSEAAADEARVYVNGGPGWIGPGWYWDPAFADYTFIPGDGLLYSPFGWGFYSPYSLYRSPYYYGWNGGGHRFGDGHYPYGHGVMPPGGFRGGGFRGAGAVRGGGMGASRGGGGRRR